MLEEFTRDPQSLEQARKDYQATNERLIQKLFDTFQAFEWGDPIGDPIYHKSLWLSDIMSRVCRHNADALRPRLELISDGPISWRPENRKFASDILNDKFHNTKEIRFHQTDEINSAAMYARKVLLRHGLQPSIPESQPACHRGQFLQLERWRRAIALGAALRDRTVELHQKHDLYSSYAALFDEFRLASGGLFQPEAILEFDSVHDLMNLPAGVEDDPFFDERNWKPVQFLHHKCLFRFLVHARTRHIDLQALRTMVDCAVRQSEDAIRVNHVDGENRSHAMFIFADPDPLARVLKELDLEKIQGPRFEESQPIEVKERPSLLPMTDWIDRLFGLSTLELVGQLSLSDDIDLGELHAPSIRELTNRNWPNGTTVLHHLVCGWPYDRSGLFHLFVAAGADVNAVDDHGNRPLHEAEHAEWVELLLKYGADLHVFNNEGLPPAHQIMLSLGELEADMLQLLVEAGLDVNLQTLRTEDALWQKRGALYKRWNCGEQTLLHMTAQFDSRAECAQQLLDAGADPSLKDANGKTPLDLAIESQQHFVAEVLRRG